MISNTNLGGDNVARCFFRAFGAATNSTITASRHPQREHHRAR
jgi:hypothetical protein